MPFTSRGAIALVSAGCMLAAVYASRDGYETPASWLMAAGFVLATLWTLLSVAWAYEFPERSAMSWRSWLTLVPVAAIVALYYVHKARRGEGLR